MSDAAKIPKRKIKKFLEDFYHKPIKILECSFIGKGFMASGYKIVFLLNKKMRQIVVRTLSPVDFSHDYAGDRAGDFLIHHHSARLLPNHVKSLSVVGMNSRSGQLEAVHHHQEFFQILEYAKGQEYGRDLERIFKEKKASDGDFQRALLLSDYLAAIHKKKLKADEKQILSLYKRHTRDYIGSIFLMDVLDTYPHEITFTSWSKIYELVSLLYQYREKIKNKHHRLVKIHGDFHPGNIRFYQENKFVVLDAARHIWGEAADDVICLGINYIWYALRQTGRFAGVFQKLFQTFWQNYLKQSKDTEMIAIAPLYFGLRGVVLNHPSFFNVKDEIRQKIFFLTLHFLKKERFESSDINQILAGYKEADLL